MRNILQCLFAAVLVLSASIALNAQTALSPEKRNLISEIVVLTKMDKQMTELTDVILKQMESSYLAGFNEVLDRRTDLSTEQKERLKSTSAEGFLSFSAKFRERLPKVVDYRKYIEEGIYPLYDKFYTEQELKDLVAFYKTPTGQKVVSTMPQLYAESNKRAQEILLPQVFPLIRQLLDEEMKKVGSPAADSNITDPPKPKPKRDN